MQSVLADSQIDAHSILEYYLLLKIYAIILIFMARGWIYDDW